MLRVNTTCTSPFNRLEFAIPAFKIEHAQRLTLASADENQWHTLLELALKHSLSRLPSFGSTFRAGRRRRKQLRCRLQTVLFQTSFYSEFFLDLRISERAEGFYSIDKAGSTHQKRPTCMIPLVLEAWNQEHLNSSNIDQDAIFRPPNERYESHSSPCSFLSFACSTVPDVLRPL